MSATPPAAPDNFRESLIEFQQRYWNPGKQFVKESFQENPGATIAVATFAATVLTLLPLALFSICLALSLTLVVTIGIGMWLLKQILNTYKYDKRTGPTLIVLLSTTAVSSLFILTLIAGAAFGLRKRGFTQDGSSASASELTTQPTTPSDPRSPPVSPRAAIATAKRILNAVVRRFLKRGSWKTRLLAGILVADLISRIRLPRVVRYNFFYRIFLGASLFGPRRNHPFQRTLGRPFRTISGAAWLARRVGLGAVFLPARLFGWKAPLMVYLTLLAFSPRVRAHARRNISCLAYRAWAAAGAGTTAILRSETAQQVLDLPWKAYTETVLACTKEIAYSTLALLIAFLRTQLEQLEESTVEAPPAEAESAPAAQESVPPATDKSTPESTPSQAEESTYEMVAPVLIADTAGSTAVPEDSTQSFRARRIPTGVSEDH
ncbi:hypothetical protein C8R43DRAFT_554564 [Mycena crocata]|nr:hypothetical protein C8R43DRAFT_554564 [Mycena crocata]